ncbi:hypothetical protein PR048_004046 [Dryococelus australis]|uniref:Uncharacterized protein n=1 Tax=Dryococelus australis TaxID=614101 RepID=A0ABQ9I6C3_9NEOP|nr:hypothetical protein PR048_004046 [Dryococelus australis]
MSKVKIPLPPPLNPHLAILSGDRGAGGCCSFVRCPSASKLPHLPAAQPTGNISQRAVANQTQGPSQELHSANQATRVSQEPPRHLVSACTYLYCDTVTWAAVACGCKPLDTTRRGHGGVVVRLLVSYQGEPGSAPSARFFIGDLRFLPALAFMRSSIPTLIGSQYHVVKSRPNLFTHSLTRQQEHFPSSPRPTDSVNFTRSSAMFHKQEQRNPSINTSNTDNKFRDAAVCNCLQSRDYIVHELIDCCSIEYNIVRGSEISRTDFKTKTPVETGEELLTRVMVAAQQIDGTPCVMERVYPNIIRRCNVCNDVGGRHIEPLLETDGAPGEAERCLVATTGNEFSLVRSGTFHTPLRYSRRLLSLPEPRFHVQMFVPSSSKCAVFLIEFRRLVTSNMGPQWLSARAIPSGAAVAQWLERFQVGPHSDWLGYCYTISKGNYYTTRFDTYVIPTGLSHIRWLQNSLLISERDASESIRVESFELPIIGMVVSRPRRHRGHVMKLGPGGGHDRWVAHSSVTTSTRSAAAIRAPPTCAPSASSPLRQSCRTLLAAFPPTHELSVFETEKRESDRGDTATHFKCPITAKREALNWRAVIQSHSCTYGTFSGDPIILLSPHLVHDSGGSLRLRKLKPDIPISSFFLFQWPDDKRHRPRATLLYIGCAVPVYWPVE